MHVVLIIPRFHPFWGGTEIRMKRVAEALSARGFRFTVLTRRLDESLPRRESVSGIDIVRLPAPLFLFSFFARQWLAKHAGEIDLIHSFRIDKCSLAGAWAGRRYAIFHIAEIITNEAEKMLKTAAGRKKLFRIDAGTAKFHCLSADTAQGLATSGIASEKIWLRGNAVDTDVFYPAPEATVGGPVTVMCSGRLERQKGTDILIAAWRALPPEVSAKAQLLLAGSGKWDRRLRSAASTMTNVVFMGTVARDDMPELYRKAQIYVQPSRFEGMSNAILEALASGLPIVSTDIGANRSVIEQDINGHTVPTENPRELADAMSRLITDADLRRRMGWQSRRIAEKRFTFPALFDDIENVYRKAFEQTNT